MTDTAISIPQADIELLEQLYTFRGRTEILQFLDQYPFLVRVLLEAPEKIRQYFPNYELFLEVIPDPEIIDYVLLVLSIVINLDPNDAVDRLNQMNLDWWLKNTTHEVRRNLCTLLEYPNEF